MVSLWGASSFIRSVQYGSIATTGNSADATISAVVIANSVVHHLGITNSGTNITYLDQGTANVVTLSSTTQVNFATGAAPAGGTNTVEFCVIEYAPGVIKSRQVISITGSNTTITAVNPAKTVLVWNGTYSTSAYPLDLVVTPRVTLQTSTNVLMSYAIGGYFTVYGRITVLEYF